MGFIGEFGFEFPGNRNGETVKVSYFNSMEGKVLLVETNTIYWHLDKYSWGGVGMSWRRGTRPGTKDPIWSQALVVYAFNPSAWEAEVEESL